jgi:hypothetical protein
MTSRHWKEKRERERFRLDLEEYHRDGVDSSVFQTLSQQLEGLYWEDCRNGLFDDNPDWPDDPYEEQDWDHGPDYLDPYDLEDSLTSLRSLITVNPGDHVRQIETGKVYLVLEDYRLANLLTGTVMNGSIRYIHEDNYEKIF